MSIISKAGYSGESEEDKVNAEIINDWSDLDCLEYLDSLDRRPNLEVTDFESEFIESQLERGVVASLSRKQRLVVAKMYKKYGN